MNSICSKLRKYDYLLLLCKKKTKHKILLTAVDHISVMDKYLKTPKLQDEKYVFYSCFYELVHESLKRSTFPFSESSICSSRHSKCTHTVLIVSSICAYRAFIVRSPCIHLRSLLRSVRAHYLVSNTNVPMFLFLYLFKKNVWKRHQSFCKTFCERWKNVQL